MARGQNIRVRMQLVGSGKFARARYGHGMPPSCAAFSGQQVVVTVSLVKVRTLRKANGGAFENVVNRSYQLALRRRVFLQRDPSETVVTRPVVKEHVDQVFSAVVIMEERRIEAAAIQVDRI